MSQTRNDFILHIPPIRCTVNEQLKEEKELLKTEVAAALTKVDTARQLAEERAEAIAYNVSSLLQSAGQHPGVRGQSANWVYVGSQTFNLGSETANLEQNLATEPLGYVPGSQTVTK